MTEPDDAMQHPVDRFVERHAIELRALVHQLDPLEGRVVILKLKPDPDDRSIDTLVINIARDIEPYREPKASHIARESTECLTLCGKVIDESMTLWAPHESKPENLCKTCSRAARIIG